jgi:hypothetical protein
MPETPQPPDTDLTPAGKGVDFSHLSGEIATIADGLHDRAIRAGLSPEQAESFNKLIGHLGDLGHDLLKYVAEGQITPEECIAEFRETGEIILASVQK